MVIYAGWQVAQTQEWIWKEIKIFKPESFHSGSKPGEYPISTVGYYELNTDDDPTNLIQIWLDFQEDKERYGLTRPYIRFFSSQNEESELGFTFEKLYDISEGNIAIFALSGNGAEIRFRGRYNDISSYDGIWNGYLGKIGLIGNLAYTYGGTLENTFISMETLEKQRLKHDEHTFYNFPENMLFVPCYKFDGANNWAISRITSSYYDNPWMPGTNNAYRNLSSTYMWKQFLFGGQPIENPAKLNYEDSEDGIILSYPIAHVDSITVYDEGREQRLPESYGFDMTSHSFEYYSLGTEINSLFHEDSIYEEKVYLNAGYISRRFEKQFAYYKLFYDGYFLEWKVDAGWEGSRSFNPLFLVINPTFVPIDADNWINYVPDDYTTGDYETSPFLLYTYIGDATPDFAKATYFDYSEHPSAVWPLMSTQIATYSWGDTYWKMVLTEESLATKEFWTGILSGIKGKGTKWGEGSIGGGFSHTAGGNGGFDDSSDSIDGGSIHSLTESSKISCYEIDEVAIVNFISAVNAPVFFSDLVNQNKRGNILSALISLYGVYSPSGTISRHREQKVGITPAGETIENFTGYPVKTVTRTDVTDWVKIGRYFDNCLDFKSRYQLYLPYVGLVELDTSIIVGNSIKIVFSYDVIASTGVYIIMLKTDTFESVIATYPANLGAILPITSEDYSGKITGVKTIVGSVVTAGIAMATKNVGMAVGAAAGTAYGISELAKDNPVKTSSVTANAGNLSPRQCYLIITRHPWSMPENYAHQYGLPSNITSTLGSLKGFTKVASIHLDNCPATKEEKAQIESKLKEGVVIR